MTERLPLYYARNPTLFPVSDSSLDVGRTVNVAAVQEIEGRAPAQRILFVAAQRDPRAETPTQSDLYLVGIVVIVKEISTLAPDNLNLAVEGGAAETRRTPPQ